MKLKQKESLKFSTK